MTANVGVKALLEWVNGMKLSDRDITMDDLQDGTFLLKIVHLLKKDSLSSVDGSKEDRFRFIAEFVQRNCRLSTTKGTPISLDNIRDGNNSSVEIAKVLLLLLYHDMMNDRCTLNTMNTLEPDVEVELAHLTDSFVIESDGCVHLSERLDAYLSTRLNHEKFKWNETPPSSNLSPISSLSDNSPVFHRTQRVSFVDTVTVASSSLSKSPLEEIMNTPKFQVRKMKRQMIMEREYRDCLERDMMSLQALIAQRESRISQLQNRLDKLKDEQCDQERLTRNQLEELETKNNMLQMRLNEMLKENKDLKSTSSLMEHKVDELTDENGVLSSQMRTVCSQLVTFEAKIGILTQTQASAQQEWKVNSSQLQSELIQATAQKELLTERIQILQGKIACLEDEINKATKEEVGENMGAVMERDMLESEISSLQIELENTVCSLEKAEVKAEAKTQQLAEYRQEISQHQELLKEEKSKTEEIIRAKDEVFDKMQKEMMEQSAVLQQEIQSLKVQLEQVEQQKSEQTLRLQQQVEACKEEIEKLQEVKKEKEDLLLQTEEKVKDLETKLAVASALIVDKEQQINVLKEEVDMLTDKTSNDKCEIQALTTLLLEKSNEQENLNDKILTLSAQIDNLGSSLKQAECEIQHKQDLLNVTQLEIMKEKEILQQQIMTHETEAENLKAELQEKNQQLVMLNSESSEQTESLEEEIKGLKSQLEMLDDSLRKAKEQVQDQEDMLTKQQQESAHQKEVLQHQLSAAEEAMKSMKEEIQTKEVQMSTLENHSSEQSERLCQEIQDLKQHAECLSSSLRTAEENFKSKETLHAEQQLQSTQCIKELQAQMEKTQDEVKRLNAEINTKEEQLDQLKTETSTHSEMLQQELDCLKEQLKSTSSSLEKAIEEVAAKENLIAKQEQESILQIEKLEKHGADLEQEVTRLRQEIQDMLTKQQQESAHQKEILQHQLSAAEEAMKSMKDEIQTKEVQMSTLENHSSEQSGRLCQEIQDLKQHAECLSSSLRTAEENFKSKETLHAEQQLQSTQCIKELQAQMESTQDEVKRLNAEINTKEEQLDQLKTETSTHSELLQQDLDRLKEQLKNTSSSLEKAIEEVGTKENLIAKQEQESILQIEKLQKHGADLEQEVTRLRQEIHTKQAEVDELKYESSKESEVLQNEVKVLKDQLQQLNESLRTATEQVLANTSLLTEKEMEITLGKNTLDKMMKISEEEITSLKAQLEQNQVSLRISEEKNQSQLDLISKEEQETAHQKEQLQQQLSVSEEEVRKMKTLIEAKEEQLALLKTDSSEQLELLYQEIQDLKKQMETLQSLLKKTQLDVQSKEDLLSHQQEETAQQRDTMELLHQEIQDLKKQVETLQSLLKKTQLDVQSKEDLLSHQQEETAQQRDTIQSLQEKVQQVDFLQKEISSRDQNLNMLRDQVAAKEDTLEKAKEEAEGRSKILVGLQEESSKQVDVLQNEIQNLKRVVETDSLKLLAQEQQSLETLQESEQKTNLLLQQLVAANAQLNQYKETQAENLRLKEAVQELKATTLREEEAHVQEKQELQVRKLQAEKNCEVLEKRVEATALDNERLAQANQAIERENVASQKLQLMLQQELKMLTMAKDKLLKEKETAEEGQQHARELQEQLTAKSEAADHYKTQMENAVKHYNDKKQLLQKSEEEVDKLKHSLEVVEREVKAITMEKQVLQLDFNKVQTNDKKLLSKVASLESQLAFADHTLRAQSRIRGTGGSTAESYDFEVPIINKGPGTRVKKSMSDDSLNQSSLEDSLNTTTKLSFPDESSTPLVRSSERLAAKRRIQQAESLETLYFTPINTRHTNRIRAEHNSELDSVSENPTSSVKRRRTTQVINITMSKKTPRCGEEDETFYSLASARSHPNLSTAHSAHPVSMKVLENHAKKTSAAGDQLIGLPGYRQSTVNSQSGSTFCVGAENEPDGAPEDWLRIAELQARNKACLPHLKSSYPVERETGRNNAFIFSDEELRTGDPSDTIRRASMMPGQLQDSLVSHRQSLILGQTGAAGVRSHRLSLMPGHLPYKSVATSQSRSPKNTTRSSFISSVHQMSPEKKMRASCFPRPLTPKNKNVSSGPSSSHLRPALSPAERRESTMFVIDNTPNKNNYLKKGLNKLRSSTWKSPGKSSKKSPAPTSARTCKENKSAGNSRAGAARGFKSPEVAARGSRKSSQTTSRPAKSPGLTASARKMMRRMKV